MIQLALANLKAYSRRFIAVILAVMIGTAFLAATLMVNASATESLKNSIGSAYASSDLVVSGDMNAAYDNDNDAKSESFTLGSKALEAISKTPGVAAVHGTSNAGASVQAGSKRYYALVSTPATDAQLNTTTLESGTMPADGEQVAVDAVYAKEYNISVGDTIELSDGSENAKGRHVVVSGITATSNDPLTGSTMSLSVTPDLLKTLGGDTPADYNQIIVRAEDPAALASLKTALVASVEGTGVKYFTVLTPDERIVADIAMFSDGNDQLTIVLLVFALIALVVTGLVVMNTFSVLVAQRTRELALMRTLGAVRSQIRASVLVEALIVGLLASAAGVLLATGIMSLLIKILAANVSEMSFATLAVPPLAVLGTIAAGTLITLVAAWVPARKAMAVAPLAALRPADDVSLANTSGKVRIVLGLLLLAAGAAALVYGAAKGDLLIAFGGGLLSFPGILMLGSLFLPKSVAFIGKLTSGGTVPGKLASLNAVRNPGRTTATATALLIGVTLVSMMMVGAQTAKSSLGDALGSEFLVDMEVQGGDLASLTPENLGKVRELGGVESTALLTGVGETEDGQSLYAADSTDMAAVLNTDRQLPKAGEVLVASYWDGKTVKAVGDGGTKGELKLLVSEANMIDSVMTWETASSVLGVSQGKAPAETSAKLWLKVDDSLSGAQLRTLATDLASTLDVDEYAVSGGVMEKQMFNQVIDMLLLIVSGLLAVAVFIALIGVANTLSLSVLERTRENSLLRALGLTRGQLRGMLATEAVLIGGVAALLGVLIGTAYGLLGAQSVMASFGSMVVSIPWLQLAGVIAISVVAALAASIVPARRAARLAPVQGLASE
ncbi:ABC transporter permease [Paeniglutamicibacter sp. NPDC091659]|uniref:ABC transporter permease n=1 Tax=Paeniglutamicibacter sp. NPDC091659 TaxID=3364389 RepID=UPI0037F1787A